MTVLIPDTSALINTIDVYVRNHHVTDVISKLFSVCVPDQIRIEAERHESRFGGEASRIITFTRRNLAARFAEPNASRIVRHHYLPQSNDNYNGGEVAMCGLAMHQLRSQSAAFVILLSDDLKAHRGLFAAFGTMRRAVAVWDSLDLLIHIFTVHYPSWSITEAKRAVRCVFPQLGQSAIRGRSTNQDVIDTLRKHARFIDAWNRLQNNLMRND